MTSEARVARKNFDESSRTKAGGRRRFHFLESALTAGRQAGRQEKTGGGCKMDPRDKGRNGYGQRT